ncbi:MAG TPA: condensation domain-containing protein, partial [Actinophytocola sp.]|nr:condensation domain-containing protein [Actinophytocola sp.]
MVERHEVLRTVYPDTDGVPEQRVLDGVRVGLARWDDSGPDGLAAALDELAARPFDLTADLPIRAALAPTGRDEHVFALVVHHIASDGWSMGRLLGDLAVAYRARRAGHPPDWEPLPVQYADYTLWQREVLGDEDDEDSVVSGQLRYWTEALAGLPEDLPVATDRPPGAGDRGGCAGLPVWSPPEVHRGLLDLARGTGTTLFMVLRAALAAVLSRLGGGQDVPLGSVVAGRTDEALDELVGFFVNTVVLRTDLSGDPSFRELLER